MAFNFKLPNYSTSANNPLTAADKQNIAWLQNPNPNFNEVDTRAAEAGLASGAGGGTFNQNRQLKLRDSELINRYQIAHSMLEPYTNREQQQSLQTQSEGARLNEIAAQGQQAMEQLKLQEQGLATRQSSSEQAALQRAVLEGQQAMERLQTSESGQNTRQQAELDAVLARFYGGEEGQDRRLALTLGSESTRQATSEAGANARQEAALRAQLEEARLRGDQQAVLQAAQLLSQHQLQTQQGQQRLGELGVQGANQLAAGRQAGAFSIAELIARGASPAGGGGGGSGNGLRNGNGMQLNGGNDSTGEASDAVLHARYGPLFNVDTVQRNTNEPGRDFYDTGGAVGIQNTVDRILRHYNVL